MLVEHIDEEGKWVNESRIMLDGNEVIVNVPLMHSRPTRLVMR